MGCKYSDILAGSRLPALDGLRAVAVGLVIGYHAGVPVPGDLGVSIFFVLSGFLITWLLIREHDRTGTVSLTDFYRRRTLRIFPAYFALVLFSLTIDRMLGDPWTWPRAISVFTHTANYYNAWIGSNSWTLGHAWSLAVEEQFYLLWPLLFLATIRLKRVHALGVIAALIALVLIWRCVAYGHLGLGGAYVYNAFDTRFDCLAIGCGLAVIGPSLRGTRVIARPAHPFLTLAALYISRVHGSLAYHYTVGFTVDAFLIAILIVQLVQLVEARPWRWLECRPVRFLGALSYSLYLWHGWGLSIGHHAPFARAATGVVASLVFALGSYYVIERPFLAWKRKYERARPADDANAVPGGVSFATELADRHSPRSRLGRAVAEKTQGGIARCAGWGGSGDRA